MSTPTVHLLYEEICQLLAASRTFSDARAAALVTLLLAYGLSRTKVRRLSWNDFDGKTLTLRVGNRMMLRITELLAHQILAIPRTGRNIFGPFGEADFQLDCLVSEVLAKAELKQCDWDDLVSWSKLQTAQTRMAIASA